MEAILEQIREQQKQSWNKFSSGWKKWDTVNREFLGPMGTAIIDAIQPSGNDMVLDIAAGTGEPGLSIAALLNGGKVIITDLAEDMLEVAKEKAAKSGTANIDFVACDVCQLPFENNSFDAVSCRFGFMFFPDMQLAANEIRRVLKPGGKFATAVWDIPEKNFWVTAMMDIINENIKQPPPPGGTGIFRCSKPGLMQSIFETAGFTNIVSEEVPSQLNAGTADGYWNMMTEIAAPVVAALLKADTATYNAIKEQVYTLMSQKYPDGKVILKASAIVLSGCK
jgi:ubiquinone/menaquinone biosynthesis C-methylase UbiE